MNEYLMGQSRKYWRPIDPGINTQINKLKSEIKVGDYIKLATQRTCTWEKEQFQTTPIWWKITGIYPTMIECTEETKSGVNVKEYFLYQEVIEQGGKPVHEIEAA